MKIYRVAPLCLSILILLGMLFSSSSSHKVESKNEVRPAPTPTSPSKERIVTSDTGLDKLSADLRDLVTVPPASSAAGAEAAANAVAMDQASGMPLLVSAMVSPGADVQRYFSRSVRSRVMGGYQWVTGEIQLTQLRKLASRDEVFGVVSNNTYQATDAPDLDKLRSNPRQMSLKEARAFLKRGGPDLLQQEAKKAKNLREEQLAREQKAAQEERAAQEGQPASAPSAVPAQKAGGQAAAQQGPGLLDAQDAKRAQAEGYRGQNVVVGLVDTGVDFANPDLQGAQSIIKSGPYAGWPFAYDTLSGYLYALDNKDTIGPENYWSLSGYTSYVHTLPVKNPVCVSGKCSASLVLSGDTASGSGTAFQFTWADTSLSHQYYYTVHPDFTLMYIAYQLSLSYPNAFLAPPAVIVSDEKQAGVYDTVYVDINYNQSFLDPAERMRKGSLVGGAIVDAETQNDQVWDLSAGMLGWISDGINQPPGVGVVYPEDVTGAPPAAGRLLVFINDDYGHGTSCASLIAGRGQIADPKGVGPSNPMYAGGADVGGVGGPVVSSIAPEAEIAAFENGFDLPYASWMLASLGVDGQKNSGDEVNIISNSWGDSSTIADGWDPLSRFAQNISYEEASKISILVATGNGGHGYGTRTSPGGGSLIDVGASTSYGGLLSFEKVAPEQFLYGEVQPWSNRGPGTLGDVAPDIVADGAFGTAAIPLNESEGNGLAAYDVFGGTSMSTPVAAGSLALVYQAYEEQHGEWPTWEKARNILQESAKDLGYDVLVQGAGNIQVSRAVDLALDRAAQFSPSQWQAGSKYPAYPATLFAGEEARQPVTVTNNTGSEVKAALSSSVLQNFHEETFTFSFSTPRPDVDYRVPIFLKEITSWIDTYNPDLIRAQVIFPYSNFDMENDYYPDNLWNVNFYDWLDRNGNGRLWTDTNRNGRVDAGEIDIDPSSGLSEYNRFTYGYLQGDYLEASLGKFGMAQRHQGVFLGLRCDSCYESTTLQVRVTFYHKVAWDWLTLPDDPLTIVPGGQGIFDATLAVPEGTAPGVYEGAINVDMNGVKEVLPVIANVAAEGATFQFGGPGSLDHPYDNGHMFGGFNWNWRNESGDWRYYYFDVPAGTASPGKALVVVTQWNSLLTDIDTLLMGPAVDPYFTDHPEVFGPQGLQQLGGSANRYLYGGKYHWYTNTGYAREMVNMPVKDGLNMIALHNVLNSGLQFAEEFVGKVFQVSVSPEAAQFTTTPEGNNPPYLSGSQPITLTSTGDIEDGIQVQAFGMSPITSLVEQTASQDMQNDLCSMSWVYKRMEGGLEVTHGGLLDITMSAKDPNMDLDLYLLKDDGDGKWTCGKNSLIAYSDSARSNEHVKVYFPEDGLYWIAVQGYKVPAKQGIFDIQMRLIAGSDLTLRNMPLGSIKANQPVTFYVDYRGPYDYRNPTEIEGLLFIGTPSMPDMLEVPVKANPDILLYPAPVLSASTRWIWQAPVMFSLRIQNQGVKPETVDAQVQFPPELMYEIGSAGAPGGVLEYKADQRLLTWSGPLAGGATAEITFRASGLLGAPMTNVTIPVQVIGETSKQTWSLAPTFWINAYGNLLPLIRR